MQYTSVDVKCPFYFKDTRNTIKCEGIITSTCINTFGTAKTKKDHYEEKCCNKYRGCKLYRVLEQKY